MVKGVKCSGGCLAGFCLPSLHWIVCFLGSVLTLAPSVAKADSYIVPPGRKETDAGVFSGAGDLVQSMRIQTVYASSLFTNGPMLIYEMRYRPSAVYGFAFTSTYPDLQIQLSTKPGPLLSEIPFATFSDNTGTDPSLVVEGPVQVTSRFQPGPGNTKAFDIAFPFQKPFPYDPAQGSLVVELRHASVGLGTYLDVSGETDGAGRVFSTNPAADSGNWDTGANVLELLYTQTGVPPKLRLQPLQQTLYAGESGVFQVTASGSAPFRYQWLLGGQPLVDATNAVLVLTNVSLKAEGEYRVEVSNAYGKQLSDAVTLIVKNQAPVWVLTPTDVRAIAGTSTTLSAKAEGSLPLMYQWFFQGQAIPGATQPSLTWPAIRSKDAGAYSVSVQNALGSLQSPTVQVSVVEIPHIPAVLEPLGPSSRRTPLVISEFHYHPLARADGIDLEFVELWNSSAVPQSLAGFRLSGDIDFTFPSDAMLAPGAFGVVAADQVHLRAVYGITNVWGDWSGKLPNDHGTIRLRNAAGAVLLEVRYLDEDPWPIVADGTGHSLFLARPSFGEASPRAWAASGNVGGSPGLPDPAIEDSQADLQISEVYGSAGGSQAGAENFIELYNHTSISQDLSGGWLSDDPAIRKFQIPIGTFLAPGNFIIFHPSVLGFPLSAAGGRIFWWSPSGDRVIDAVHYGAHPHGTSYGRSPENPALWSLLSPETPQSANARARQGPVFFSEILYHPLSEDPEDQFIELFNRADHSIDLGGWRLSGAAQFEFPPGAVIPSSGFVVLGHNRQHLLSTLSDLSPNAIFGDYQGSLSGNGERLTLSRPWTVEESKNAGLPLDPASLASYFQVVNEIFCSPSGPGARWSDGGGASLEWTHPRSDNRFAVAWEDSVSTTNAAWTTLVYTGPHAFYDGNSPVNALEISLLGAGECLVDDVELVSGSAPTVNLVVNPDFGASGGWTAEGNHEATHLDSSGGIQNSPCLHVSATGRGDYLGNRIVLPLRKTVDRTKEATLRIHVRWLRGWPELLCRLRGNSFEATVSMETPPIIGTPGRARWPAIQLTDLATGPAPALLDVAHHPVLPQTGDRVVVTARATDPDGVASLSVHYRLDSSGVPAVMEMNDRGIDGDAVEGDGEFSATLPPFTSGDLVMFHVEARGIRNGVASFPSVPLASEALIRYGEKEPEGDFGTYRIWIPKAAVTQWMSRSSAGINNRPIGVTFVYNHSRVIYGAGASFNGSDNTSELYRGPADNLCGYTFVFPPEDLFLGTSEVILDWPTRDSTAQREQLTYWMANELGLPNNYRRYVHLHVNGIPESARTPLFADDALIYEDLQSPGSDFLKEWYPDAHRGDLYKIHVWRRDYKFPARPSPNGESYHAALVNFLDPNGHRHLPRYRWTWRKRNTRGSASDYQSLFELIDAGNRPGKDWISPWDNLVDTEQWMRVLAFERCIGNFDSYGNRNSQNVYAYRPEDGSGWQLMTFDNDLVLGSTSEDPDSDLFGIYPSAPSPEVGIPDPMLERFRKEPVFQRAYWRAFRAFVDGPLRQDRYHPFALAQYQALLRNKVPIAGGALSGPEAFEGWINARRDFILGQLAARKADFTVDSVPPVVRTNQIWISGSAPIEFKRLRVGGRTLPIEWTTLTRWRVWIPLNQGANHVEFAGVDVQGQPIQGATRSVDVELDGPGYEPEAKVLINEWMASNQSTLADSTYGAFSDWFELYNASDHAVDLSGWSVSDSAAIPTQGRIPDGLVLSAGSFLLVWADGHTGYTNSELHVPFKLKASGSQILLYDSKGRSVDGVNFGAQLTDVSQGRFPDGAPTPFLTFNVPTPGHPNQIDESVRIQILEVERVPGGSVFLTWSSIPRRAYRVQYKNQLTDTEWLEFPGEIPADVAILRWEDVTASEVVQRFYRVVLIP